MKLLRLAALASFAGLILAGPASGGTISLHPTADTSLFSAIPDNNLGANSNLVAGANGSDFPSRALIRFDLTGQIPSNAVIQSAALTLNVVIIPGGGGAASVFDLRRVLADWGEGVGTGNSGSPANPGEATWNNRFHPSTPWTVPGGAVSNDYSGTVSASMLVNGFGAYTFGSSTNLVADVQQWLLHPAANFGWVLLSEAEGTLFTARRFGSREDPANAPTLVVQYALPPGPEIQGITVSGGHVQLSFPAAAGQSYTVQYRDSFFSGDWQTLTNIPPQVTTTNLMVLDPFPTNSQRFYRVGVF